jgi:hypothetical protein
MKLKYPKEKNDYLGNIIKRRIARKKSITERRGIKKRRAEYKGSDRSWSN